MNFIIENWYIIVAMLAVAATVGFMLRHFLDLPTKEQIKAVKAWLLGAVSEAERELGSGTGQLKLRRVYDAFVERFPWLAKVIPFTTFSIWVDAALDEMRELLAQNEAVSVYVEGEPEKIQAKVGF